MKIQFSPQRSDEILAVNRFGDVLTVNGETFDFTQVGEGDTLPLEAIDSTWFVAPVTRSGGDLQVALRLPLPANYSQAQAFPEPVVLVADGPIALPQPLPESQA